MYTLAWNLIPVEKAVIDAGVTPYPYPKRICRLISFRDFCLIPLGTMNLDVMKKIMPPEEWTQEGEDPEQYYKRIYDFEKHHFSTRSNYNVFWSANNYRMPETAPVVHAEMQYWYGSAEKKDRKRDIAYVQKMFPEMKFVEYAGYGHAQLVIVHPHLFAEKLHAFIG